VQHRTAQNSTAQQYSTVRYSTIQYSLRPTSDLPRKNHKTGRSGLALKPSQTWFLALGPSPALWPPSAQWFVLVVVHLNPNRLETYELWAWKCAQGMAFLTLTKVEILSLAWSLSAAMLLAHPMEWLSSLRQGNHANFNACHLLLHILEKWM